jgi:septin family protein
VIAKADTACKDELLRFKQKVKRFRNTGKQISMILGRSGIEGKSNRNIPLSDGR